MNWTPSYLDLGGVEITIADGGDFRLDGATLYGIFPRVFWEKLNQPDEDNRVLLAVAPLIVKTDGGPVIIDPGIGHGLGSRAADRYCLRQQYPLEDLLQGADVAPEDVQGIIATHLHFDHVLAGVRGIEDIAPEESPPWEWRGELASDLEPALPNARLYVQSAEAAHAREPDQRTAPFVASLVSEVYRREDRLVLLEGDAEPFPGVNVELTGGHTPGHQVVWLKGREGTALVPGDLIPTPAHVDYEVLEGIDHAPSVSAAVKADLLARVLESGAYLTLYHSPRVRWSRVSTGPSDTYQLVDTFTVPARVVSEDENA